MDRYIPKNIEEVIENNLLVFSNEYLYRIKHCKRDKLWKSTVQLRKEYAKKIVNLVRTFKEKK